MRSVFRAVSSMVGSLALTAAAFGCHPDVAKPPQSSALGACASDAVEACEGALASAIADGRDLSEAAVAYARVREDADPATGLALTALRNAKSDTVVVRLDGAKLGTKLAAVDLARAPKPLSVSEGVAWYALAEAAKVRFLVVVRPDGSVARYYPSDVCRSFMGVLLPEVIEKKDFYLPGARPASLDADAAIERSMRDAFDGARAFDYVKAAHAIDAIEAATKGRPTYETTPMRASVLLATMALGKPTPTTWDFTAKPAEPTPPAPAASDTPYQDLLRVRIDKTNVEWPRRSARIVAAFPENRRAAVSALFGTSPGCGFALPPPIEREGDLMFQGLLPHALLPSRAKGLAGRVPLEEWYPRYTALVDVVERTHMGFASVGVLMTERGQSSGIVPSSSDTHRRAGALALQHARALRELENKLPGRVGFGQMAFLYAQGNFLDPALQKEVLDLTQVAARTGLANAEDAADVALAAFLGVMGGAQMPGELREAHFTALQSAFTAKLRGQFADKSGWGPALLFVLDAAYRELFDQSPNLKASAESVSRALESDPKIAQPGLASLTVAVTRYVSLAADQNLGTPIAEGKDVGPGRAAARASLEKAIDALGDGASVNRELAKDITDLTDGTTATVASAILFETKKPSAAETPVKKGAASKPPAASACSSENVWKPDPKTRRALEKLRDLRHKILAEKAFQTGSDAFTRRAKLLVLLLSDAIDIASDWGKPKPSFAVSEADAENTIQNAFQDLTSLGGLGEALSSSYLTFRGFEVHGKDFFSTPQGATQLRRVFASIGKFVGSGGPGGLEGADLLAALAPQGPASAQNPDLAPAFTEAAAGQYQQGKSRQGDILLLASLVITGVRNDPPPDAAIALAEKNHSKITWALKFAQASASAKKGGHVDPSTFAPAMKAALAEQCAVASVDEVTSVMGAVDAYRSGHRKEARAALETFAANAREKQLSVPRFNFSFSQEAQTRIISLALEFSLGAGFLSGANSFNLGAGAKTEGTPQLKLVETTDGPDSKRALDETARYYIHVSALTAVYDFLDGDPLAGEIAAARMLGVATQRTWLGVMGVTDNPIDWTTDARGTIAVLAQLATESGRPLLAGDLLSLLKASLGTRAEKSAVDDMFAPLPPGLAGIPNIDPVATRARATVDALVAELACMHGKDPTASFERPACDAYPKALALRVADSLHVLPALSAGPKGQSGVCPDLAALNDFLVPAQKQTYEPDKFVEALGKLMEANKNYDATVLATKHRREDHCSAAVTDKLTALADRMKGAPTARADLLSAVVNCSAGAPPAELAKTLSNLDDELAKVGDPERTARIAIFATSITAKTGAVEPLAAIALKPGFLDAWRRNNPELLGVALILDHAATLLGGKEVRLHETEKQWDLVCSAHPPPDRAPVCKLIDQLRGKGTIDERKKAAKEALTAIVGASH